MPYISITYQEEAEFLLPYILPLLQTFLTISVYSTVAITLHGLHEIQKSAQMAAPVSSPVPSNAYELTEYQTVVSTTGNDQELCIPGLLSLSERFRIIMKLKSQKAIRQVKRF